MRDENTPLSIIARTAILVFVYLLMLLIAGCGPKNYRLPSDWPIKQLTLPPDSKIVARPVAMHKVGWNSPDKDWSVYFDCPGDLAAVQSHVEQALKPLNYSRFYMDNPRIGSTWDALKTYYSSDQLTEVTLSTGTKSVAPNSTMASDYTLSIRITPQPNPMLKHANTTSSSGVKIILEPIP
ncbi:hypothetical protein JW859_14590 [bacterium]|nr:hypothetical protein [bacterium]